jgi:hypothetical protein
VLLTPCGDTHFAGYDLVGIAATGSGKTLAFVRARGSRRH